MSMVIIILAAGQDAHLCPVGAYTEEDSACFGITGDRCIQYLASGLGNHSYELGGCISLVAASKKQVPPLQARVFGESSYNNIREGTPN